MPAPIPTPIRRAMKLRLERGATPAELARDFAIAPRTARDLARRWRLRPDADVAPAYRRRTDPASAPDHPAHEPALLLRREHPGWGAPLIRVYLQRQGLAVPSARTLQRWFARAGLGPAPPGRRPDPAASRAEAPHDVWQVDAAEQVRTADGRAASWLRVVDEFSGAVLHTAVFPPGALGGGAGPGLPG